MNLRSLRHHATRLSAAVLLIAAAASPAFAQTIRLTDGNATVVRGGTYANTVHASHTVLSTRASSDLSYVRRIILKFDTHNLIPANSQISSAILTLTLVGGNAESRTISAYRVTSSYNEAVTTWNRRQLTTNWSKAGGDLAERYATDTVTNTPGSQASFDVTALVKSVVGGQFGTSRYTRIALVDTGASSRDSYKEYFSDEAGDVNVRPTLTVTYGAATAPAPAPAPAPQPSTSPSTGGTALKVLHWNIHHGVGTDGKYNIDRIATWIAKMAPDVVSLNEAERFTSYGNEDHAVRFAALLKAKTGRTWYTNFATKTGAANGEGVLWLSRFPIEASADHLLSYTRSVAQIRIVVNGRNVNLFSTHLDADSSARRATQMTQLKNWMLTFPEVRIVAGDFNTWPTAGEIPSMTGTYVDTWARAVYDNTDVAYAGNTAGNTRNSRIDYIFLSRGAATVTVTKAQVFDTRDANGVTPSDHKPLLTTFSIR